MDDATKSETAAEPTRNPLRELGGWRGDIEQRPPIWRRRPHRARMREFWDATKPLLSRIGDGKSWT